MEIAIVLEYYALFCLTTAFAALWIFYRPVLKAALECEIENALTLNPLLGQFVFVVVGLLVAPALFLAIVFPDIHAIFYQSLESVMFDED